MSNTAAQVRASTTTGEALLAIASALDRIEALSPYKPFTKSDTLEDRLEFPADDHDITDDPDLTPEEKQKALDARKNLRAEQGAAKEGRPESKIAITLGSNKDVIEVAPASGEQLMRRRPFAEQIFKGHKLYDTPELRDAFLKGGPVWLHAFDREFMLSLPIEHRRQMVEDVALTSDRDAQDLGADILKRGGPEDENPRFAPDLDAIGS